MSWIIECNNMWIGWRRKQIEKERCPRVLTWKLKNPNDVHDQLSEEEFQYELQMNFQSHGPN